MNTRLTPSNAWRFPNDDGTFDRNPYTDGGTFDVSTDINTASPQVGAVAELSNSDLGETLNQGDNGIGVNWTVAQNLVDASLTGYVIVTGAIIKGHGVNPYTV